MLGHWGTLSAFPKAYYPAPPPLSQLAAKTCIEVLSVQPSYVCIKGKRQGVTDMGKWYNSRGCVCLHRYM